MIFPSPEMNESEQGSLYQRIHRNINDLVNQSNQEGLESVTVFKNDNYIKTEYFLNSKGKEYLKVSTTKIEAILPIHSYNSDFIHISGLPKDDISSSLSSAPIYNEKVTDTHTSYITVSMNTQTQ